MTDEMRDGLPFLQNPLHIADAGGGAGGVEVVAENHVINPLFPAEVVDAAVVVAVVHYIHVLVIVHQKRYKALPKLSFTTSTALPSLRVGL